MIKPTLDVKTIRSGWADLRARVGQLDRARVQAGVLPGQYEDGVDLAEIAAAHELGTSTIPARSFVGSTVRQLRREIVTRLAAVSAAEINGAAGLADLQDLGQWISERMRRTILSQHIPPPLKDQTVRRKRAEGAADPERPLVRTGAMVRAISWRVE